MSEFKKDLLKLQLKCLDSPSVFSSGKSAGMSPVTNLAFNLSGLSTSFNTPKRRLSMSSVGSCSPNRVREKLTPFDQGFFDSPCLNPAADHGLLQGSLPGSQTSSVDHCQRPVRQVSPVPLQLQFEVPSAVDKENVPSGVPSSPSSHTSPNKGLRSPVHSNNSPGKVFGDVVKCNLSPCKVVSISSPHRLLGSPLKSFSPLKPCNTPEKGFFSPVKLRTPLEEHDTNSQDSGYAGSFLDKDDVKSKFRFLQPFGIPPKKSQPSPRRDRIYSTPDFQPLSPPPKSPTQSSTLTSHNSNSSSESISDSQDDGFADIFSFDKLDEDTQLPSGICSLLSAPIKKDSLDENHTSFQSAFQKPSFRQCLSAVDNITPTTSRARSCLFRSPSEPRALDHLGEENVNPAYFSDLEKPLGVAFKRPDRPKDYVSPVQNKRRKATSFHCHGENGQSQVPTPETRVMELQRRTTKLQRCHSETEATIMRALQRSAQEPDLIGNFTKPYSLPLVPGKHQDLKCISCDTMAAIVRGEYDHIIESCVIVDCRYPYEYEGGHIKGARNIYTKEQLWKEYLQEKETKASVVESSSSTAKRNIFVFHCEFSSERGPNLSRFLRNKDREMNRDAYPLLHFPEIYLLSGGYKAFYEIYKDLCEPCAYVLMLDANHESDLRHFRAKSKSSGDCKGRVAARTGLKRLGL